MGLGRRLVDHGSGFARAAGYRSMVLWTNDPLAAARRIYLERASDWWTKNATAASVPNSSDRTTCSCSDARILRRSRRG